MSALHQRAGNNAVESLLGGGAPLDPGLRADMEARFGEGFENVRIHDDDAAHSSAAQLAAKAYTVGDDIVFSAERYEPHSAEGKRLLAHELAHVVQQRRGGPAADSSPDAIAERGAEAAAQVSMAGTGPITVQGATSVGIARDRDEDKPPAPKPLPGVDPDVDADVERAIVEADKDQPAPKGQKPAKRKSNKAAKDARKEFNKGRDKHAAALSVGKGGQVHHGIEIQALKRYPGAFSVDEVNDEEGMRGIPPEKGGKRQLHNSKIREVWDRHYVKLDELIKQQGLKPGTAAYKSFVRKYLLDARSEMDHLYGQFYSEQRAAVAGKAPAKSAKPAKKAKPAAKPAKKAKPAAKPAKKAKPAAKPAKKAKPAAKPAKKAKPAAKPATKAKPAAKPAAKPTSIESGTAAPQPGRSAVRAHSGSLARGGLRAGRDALVGLAVNWVFGDPMAGIENERMKKHWKEKVEGKWQADLEQLFKEEGDLDHWVNWGLERNPLGRLYAKIAVRTTTDVSIVDFDSPPERQYWDTEYIGVSISTDPAVSQTAAGVEPMGFGHHEHYVEIINAELADLRAITMDEVREVHHALLRIQGEWSRVSGVGEPALTKAGAALIGALSLMHLRQEKEAGEALGGALQALPAISWADAVDDERLKLLAAEIDAQRAQLAAIVELFR
jgi:outer membrane biosynthesis protein TonB